jgi:hypothetical protein
MFCGCTLKTFGQKEKNITTSSEIIFSSQCLIEYYTTIHNTYTMIIIIIYYPHLGICRGP